MIKQILEQWKNEEKCPENPECSICRHRGALIEALEIAVTYYGESPIKYPWDEIANRLTAANKDE